MIHYSCIGATGYVMHCLQIKESINIFYQRMFMHMKQCMMMNLMEK